MTTATITDLELLRTRVSGAIGQRMPEHIGRLGWDAGRLAAHQRHHIASAALSRANIRKDAVDGSRDEAFGAAGWGYCRQKPESIAKVEEVE